MTKADNIADPNSCLNRAAIDEPIFVLRANDPMAADTVIMWANKYALRKGGYARMNEREQQKYLAALECAQKMNEWNIAHDDIPF